MNETALEIRGLQARYGRKVVLNDIHLDLAPGEWFALLGPNGSGKSSLLHCVADRMAPCAGEVRIAGHSLRNHPIEAKRRLGYACAPERLPALLTGRQCLEVYAAAKELREIDATVLDLAEKLRFTAYLDAAVDTYSLGTRQKLSVLLALLGAPRLLVLDETFNGLDPASALTLKRHLQALLQRGECAVFLATHSLDIVEHYASRAALLVNGRIAQTWNREGLDALRGEGADSLELALAAAAEEKE